MGSALFLRIKDIFIQKNGKCNTITAYVGKTRRVFKKMENPLYFLKLI